MRYRTDTPVKSEQHKVADGIEIGNHGAHSKALEAGHLDDPNEGISTPCGPRRTTTRSMPRARYFFWRLLVAALLVAAPLISLHAWTLYRNLNSAEVLAVSELHDKAVSVSSTVDTAIGDAERTLKFVVNHEEVRSLNRVDCTKFLRGLEDVDTTHAGIFVFDLQGQLVCTSIGDAESIAASSADQGWFAEAVASDDFRLGKPPVIGRVSKRPVVVLTLPIVGDQGGKVAIAGVSIDLLRLESSMVGSWKAEHGVIALLNDGNQFLVRSPDTLKWMGKGASTGVKYAALDHSGGEVIAPGIEGVERVFSAAVPRKYGLRVVASVPSDDVFGRARSEVRASVGAAAAAIVLALCIAWVGAKALAAPVRSLARSARALSGGDDDPNVRANEDLPGEFKQLAIEMNVMHDALRTSEKSAVAAQKQSVRIARFYEASWRTNQATIRFTSPEHLYDEICEICVDTGQASMAWIGLVDHRKITPVSWGGGAEKYTAGLIRGLDQDQLFVGGDDLDRALEGWCRIVNDYMTDTRTLEYRENASPFGVRSSAIVTFMCNGSVVGALFLYAKEPGLYDKQVEKLLREMASDIGYGLDKFEEAAAHERTRTELVKNEQQLTAIVDSAMVPVITIDANQSILVFNGAASRVFRVAPSEVIGRRVAMFIPKRLRADHDQRVESFLRDSEVGPDAGLNREHIGLRGDGSEFPMITSTTKIWDGHQTLLTIVLRDISGSREADESRAAAELADASNKAKSNFLTRMSHELRTPLNAVLGFTQLLQQSTKEKLTERESHQLDLIFLAGAQLRALVDDVLDVTGIESGKLSLSLQNFDLVSLLDGVMRMSEAAARSAGIILKATFTAQDDIQLRSDPVRLRQVALNLVSNAIKYNEVGGTVTVGIEARHGLVEICVSDDGMGMTAEQLCGLFQPFNRLGRESTSIAGSGIGMALVRQLVELMGGTITVESEAGTGTLARVELPRPKIAEQLVDTSALRHIAETEALIEGAAGVVLYIEDNPVNVMLVSHIFKLWPGVRVVVAEDGAAGLALAAEIMPDLILLDMHLPDMDGMDVLKALKLDPATHALRVVALSASALSTDMADAKDAGAEDYWTKPIDVNGFRRGIERTLTLHKQVH